VGEAGETERYSQMFNHLIAKALSPEDVPWRKFTDSNNGGECVELATWRKASHSGNGNNCVKRH
jgi:hypothetical protein